MAEVRYHRRLSLLAVLLWVALPPSAFTQTHFLSGTVRDGSTSELLPFVTIYSKAPAVGTSTDARGTYKLALRPGAYELIISLVGDKTEMRHVEIVDKDRTLHIKLFPTDILLQEVTVYSSPAEHAPQAKMGADIVAHPADTWGHHQLLT
jgi:hypothetical protein